MTQIIRLVEGSDRSVRRTLHELGVDFVEHYNHRRLHKATPNVMPADVYCRRQATILSRRGRIKRATLKQRRRLNRRAA